MNKKNRKIILRIIADVVELYGGKPSGEDELFTCYDDALNVVSTSLDKLNFCMALCAIVIAAAKSCSFGERGIETFMDSFVPRLPKNIVGMSGIEEGGALAMSTIFTGFILSSGSILDATAMFLEGCFGIMQTEIAGFCQVAVERIASSEDDDEIIDGIIEQYVADNDALRAISEQRGRYMTLAGIVYSILADTNSGEVLRDNDLEIINLFKRVCGIQFADEQSPIGKLDFTKLTEELNARRNE
jgi:hypothetical protein